MASAIKRKPLAWPVVEIFGPTIQGEGVDQGVVSHFVRFGGCDYRCVWCDTPHAVLPAEVRQKAERLGPAAIVERLLTLEGPQEGPLETHSLTAPWVILTGGNPALHDLSSLVSSIHDYGGLVAVETQGSRWRDWMADLDRVCVSPKPPSAKQDYDFSTVQSFLEQGLRARAQGREYEWLFLKVPVFDEADLDWCVRLRSQLSDALLYLSAGNDAGRTVGDPTRVDDRSLEQVRSDLSERFLWLVNETYKRPELRVHDVILQAQMHVIAWGNQIGH